MFLSTTDTPLVPMLSSVVVLPTTHADIYSSDTQSPQVMKIRSQILSLVPMVATQSQQSCWSEHYAAIPNVVN